MKTFNDIFRVLFIVTALISGTNTVLADEQLVWQGTFDQYNNVSCGAATGYTFASDSKLRIYIYNRNLQLTGNWGQALDIENGVDGYVGYEAYDERKGYFEAILKSGAVSTLKAQGLKINNSANFTVSKVTLVRNGGSERDITSSYSSSGTFSSITTSSRIRIYATFTNVGKLSFTTYWGSSMFGGAEYVLTANDLKTGYTDVALNDANVMLWKNEGGLNIVHNNSGIGISKVTIVSTGGAGNPSEQTKTDVTLSFSSSFITVGLEEVFTEPTLKATANKKTVSGLSYTFTSSNTDVATVTGSGALTIKSVGTTNITATFEGNDKYNSATTSYTLNVVPSYTITFMLDNEPFDVQHLKAGDAIKSKSPSYRYGYTFEGWKNLPRYMPSEDITIYGYYAKVENTITVSVGSSSYNTFCSDQALYFKGNESILAYIATEKNPSTVALTQVIGKVAAGTGLLLKGWTSNITEQIEVVDEGSTYQHNLLVGVTSDVEINSPDSYVLVQKEDGVKFADTGYKPATVPAGKAYLHVPNSNSRLFNISFENNEATGISVVSSDVNKQDAVYYNLGGQRVSAPVNKGLYVTNGKKVIVR